eukprot:683317-Pelagomonas_calceolata.AAC.4
MHKLLELPALCILPPLTGRGLLRGSFIMSTVDAPLVTLGDEFGRSTSAALHFPAAARSLHTARIRQHGAVA